MLFLAQGVVNEIAQNERQSDSILAKFYLSISFPWYCTSCMKAGSDIECKQFPVLRVTTANKFGLYF